VLRTRGRGCDKIYLQNIMKRIYLDYAATTPVDKEVLRERLPYFSNKFGNAMSIHNFGKIAGEAVEKARRQTADFFGAGLEEIVFTSGATESNNLAIKGVVKAYYEKNKNNQTFDKPHIITTLFEHHCVLDASKSLEKEKLAEVTFIKPNQEGIIEAKTIKKAIKPNTILVSVMYVNNEIGTVQPIAEIGHMLEGYKNKSRKHKLIFHTDATQAVNYFDCDVNKLRVDMLSMSAHKIYGPKGIGALYVKQGTPIVPIQDGGGQEWKLRAGTHNVPGIVGLGSAVSMIKEQRTTNNKKIIGLRNYLIGRVLKEITESKLNGSKIKRSPNNANVSFARVEGESLLMMLDMEGIACSTGSACSSGALAPSHVLLSIGLMPEKAHGSLRITLGKYTTERDIDVAVNKLKKIIERLRKISGTVLADYYDQKTN